MPAKAKVKSSDAVLRTAGRRKQPPKQPKMTADGIMNLLANLGTQEDKTSHTSYTTTLTTDYVLSSMYRTDWMAKKIINIIPHDMVREWRTFSSNEDPEVIDKLIDAEQTFSIQKTILFALQWARLFGGSAILIGVENGVMSEPLNITTIKQGSLRFLRVIDKRYIYPVGVDDVYNPASNNFMNPEYYSISNLRTLDGAKQQDGTRIHRTRIIRFDGMELPLEEFTTNQFWGDSVLQHVYSVVSNTGVVQSAIASLVFESNIDIVKVTNLGEMLANEEGDEIAKRWAFARMMKSINRMLLMDGKEEYERKQISFAELPNVLKQYLQIVSAAADIPATRLLGSSPDGMNATGESDLRNYYDSLRSEQNNLLRPKLQQIDKILCMHVFGRLIDDLKFTFNPLWQESALEKADRTLKEMQRDTGYLAAGVLPASVVAKELQQKETYINISDEYIDELEQVEEEEQNAEIPEDFNLGAENGNQQAETTGLESEENQETN